MTNPQPPTWAQQPTPPPQPGWTPPSPPRRSAWSRLTGWQQGLIVAGAVLALATAGAILAPSEDTNSDSGGSTSEPDSPAAPAYTITGRDEQGMQTYVDVEVESADGLRDVFDDVIAGLDQDGGYFVQINCATGGSTAADVRLANGRYAVGADGAAATGLDDGAAEFERVEGAACPAT